MSASPLYRQSTNQSSSTLHDDVGMAQDELYSGPMAESLPTSVSAFSHRRRRADSTASFTYYDENEDGDPEHGGDDGDDYGSAVFYADDAADIDNMPFGVQDEPADEESSSGAEAENSNAHDNYAMHRRSSTLSRSSVHARLLRTESGASGASGFEKGRVSQKLHMANEDLTIVIAGFRTRTLGYMVYLALCAATAGLGYLVLRWLPRWRVKLMGQPSPLRECQWVVLEVSRSTQGVLHSRSADGAVTEPMGRDVHS